MGIMKRIATRRQWNPELYGDTPTLAAYRKIVRDLMAEQNNSRRQVAEGSATHAQPPDRFTRTAARRRF